MEEQGTLYFLTGPDSGTKRAVGRLLADCLRARRSGAALYLDDEILYPMFEIVPDTPDHCRELAVEHELPLCRLMTGQGIDVTLCSVTISDAARAWAADHIPQFRELALPEGQTPEEIAGKLEAALFPGETRP